VKIILRGDTRGEDCETAREKYNTDGTFLDKEQFCEILRNRFLGKGSPREKSFSLKRVREISHVGIY
jgi:hypothetical protein